MHSSVHAMFTSINQTTGSHQQQYCQNIKSLNPKTQNACILAHLCAGSTASSAHAKLSCENNYTVLLQIPNWQSNTRTCVQLARPGQRVRRLRTPWWSSPGCACTPPADSNHQQQQQQQQKKKKEMSWNGPFD
jgi:hypothetical protein